MSLDSLRKVEKPEPVTAETYAEFQNLEEVKDAVAAKRLSVADARDWEMAGKARKSYLAWFQEELETAPATEKPKAAQVHAGSMEGVTVRPSREEVAKRLRNAERGYMLQKERVKNPALPSRPDEVRDWMANQFDYYWVPCPPRTRQFHPMEHQNLDKFLRSGWEFYPWDYIDTSPNAQGYPWHPAIEKDGSKVRWNDHWLMYRSSEFERRAHEESLRRWNAKREARSGPQGEGYVGTRVVGETTVDKVLRERDDDAQDRELFPR
jgi:hypothetical protein